MEEENIKVSLRTISQNEKTCNICRKENDSMLRCSGCKKVFYCNVLCQRKDWKNHKQECKKVVNQSEEQKETKKEEPLKESFNSISDFVGVDNVGVGNFTNVVKGKWKQNGKEYAIKVINK